MKNQWLSKFLSAFLIVMLALAALPVKPAYAAAAQLDNWTASGFGASGCSLGRPVWNYQAGKP
jgi:hypothetical protein